MSWVPLGEGLFWSQEMKGGRERQRQKTLRVREVGTEQKNQTLRWCPALTRLPFPGLPPLSSCPS